MLAITQTFSDLNDDSLSPCTGLMAMLLLFPFSCEVDYTLCFAYLQDDFKTFKDALQYEFWTEKQGYTEQYPHHLNYRVQLEEVLNQLITHSL